MSRFPQAKSKPKATSADSAMRTPASPANPVKPRTKAENIIAMLKGKRGATLAEMTQVTGWQEHSVRGFLAGALRNRHGLNFQSEKASDGPRRYRLR